MLHQTKSSISLRYRSLILAAGLGLAGVLAIVLFHAAGVHAQLAAWKLVPTPEAYTELYFNQNLSLPKSLTQDPIRFNFTIHNVEGQTATYPYLVLLRTADGRTQRLAGGNVTLADGGVRTITETITLPANTPTSEVMVVLTGEDQEIHFWLGAN